MFRPVPIRPIQEGPRNPLSCLWSPHQNYPSYAPDCVKCCGAKCSNHMRKTIQEQKYTSKVAPSGPACFAFWWWSLCFLHLTYSKLPTFIVFKIYQARILPRILTDYSVSTAMIPFNKGHYEKIMFLCIASIYTTKYRSFHSFIDLVNCILWSLYFKRED